MVLWCGFQYVLTSCQLKVPYRVWVTESGAGVRSACQSTQVQKGLSSCEPVWAASFAESVKLTTQFV